MSTVVIVTGGFDPIHSGHIAYLNAARRLGDKLVVGINSDDWLERKKGYVFMPFVERQTVIGNLKAVDYTFAFDDSDNSACDAINRMAMYWPFYNMIFANGGDRISTNIPELILSKKYSNRLKFEFGVGGVHKMNSSSNILSDFSTYIIKAYQHDTSQETALLGRTQCPPTVPCDETKKTVQSFFDGKRFSSAVHAPIRDGEKPGRSEEVSAPEWIYSDIYDYPSWTYDRGQE